jgi:hypothetical protein
MKPSPHFNPTQTRWANRAAICLLAGWVLVTGCHTKKTPPPALPEPPRGYLNTLPDNAVLPALPATLPQAAIGETLAAHDFPPPKKILHPDGTIWEISSRPRSATEIVMVLVKVLPNGEVQVELDGYARVGSDWAVLGALFQGPLKQEAAEILHKIQAKLRHTPT